MEKSEESTEARGAPLLLDFWLWWCAADLRTLGISSATVLIRPEPLTGSAVIGTAGTEDRMLLLTFGFGLRPLRDGGTSLLEGAGE